MRDVMTAVESSDLVSLLEKTRVWAEEQAGHADSEAAGQYSGHSVCGDVCVWGCVQW